MATATWSEKKCDVYSDEPISQDRKVCTRIDITERQRGQLVTWSGGMGHIRRCVIINKDDEHSETALCTLA